MLKKKIDKIKRMKLNRKLKNSIFLFTVTARNKRVPKMAVLAKTIEIVDVIEEESSDFQGFDSNPTQGESKKPQIVDDAQHDSKITDHGKWMSNKSPVMSTETVAQKKQKDGSRDANVGKKPRRNARKQVEEEDNRVVLCELLPDPKLDELHRPSKRGTSRTRTISEVSNQESETKTTSRAKRFKAVKNTEQPTSPNITEVKNSQVEMDKKTNATEITGPAQSSVASSPIEKEKPKRGKRNVPETKVAPEKTETQQIKQTRNRRKKDENEIVKPTETLTVQSLEIEPVFVPKVVPENNPNIVLPSNEKPKRTTRKNVGKEAAVVTEPSVPSAEEPQLRDSRKKKTVDPVQVGINNKDAIEYTASSVNIANEPKSRSTRVKRKMMDDETEKSPEKEDMQKTVDKKPKRTARTKVTIEKLQPEDVKTQEYASASARSVQDVAMVLEKMGTTLTRRKAAETPEIAAPIVETQANEKPKRTTRKQVKFVDDVQPSELKEVDVVHTAAVEKTVEPNLEEIKAKPKRATKRRVKQQNIDEAQSEDEKVETIELPKRPRRGNKKETVDPEYTPKEVVVSERAEVEKTTSRPRRNLRKPQK